ncbi:MAG: succinoglycan biosynthesis protein exop [Phyllobacteriaceae bacterium]|nr:succinoglycan biosynthesis protein exop [Phyllobacteriaceae bacterium]
MAFAELLVDPRNLQIVDRDLTGNGYMATEATLSLIENQVRIMRSGPVLYKVAEKLHLDADPEFNGAGKSFGLSSLLATLRGLLSSSDGPTAGEARMALTIDKLARAIDIERAGKTFIVEISAKSRDAAKSALIANALVDTYLEKAASFQSENAGRATGELSGRLDEMRKAVEASERKVEDYKAENDLVDAKGVLIGDDELVRLNDQLTVARAKTLELNARAASARELDAEAVISGNLPEQVSNVSLSQLRSQYATLAQEVAKSAVRLGPRHPQRQAAEAQLADARASIERELRRVTASIQIEMKRAVQFEQELSSRLSQIKSRQAMVSDKLVQLREIERDSAAKRAVYESYLLRARETGEQQGVNTGNISVVSRATPSLEPTGPSRTLIAILGTILGFAAGVGIGMARGIWSSLKSGGSPSGGARPAVAPARNAQLDPNPTRREMPISAAGLAASAEPPALAPAILPAASNPPRAEQPQMPASPYAAPVPAHSPSTVYPEPQPPVWPPAPWGPAFTPQPQMAPSPYAALVPAPSPYAVYPQPQPPVWPQAPWLTPSAPQPMFFAPQPAVMPPMMMPYAPQPVWPSHPQGQQVAPRHPFPSRPRLSPLPSLRRPTMTNASTDCGAALRASVKPSRILPRRDSAAAADRTDISLALNGRDGFTAVDAALAQPACGPARLVCRLLRQRHEHGATHRRQDCRG